MANYMERMKAKSKDSKSVLQTLQEMEGNGVGEEYKPESLENNEQVKRIDTENENRKSAKESKTFESTATDEEVAPGMKEELVKKKEKEVNKNLVKKQNTNENLPEQIEGVQKKKKKSSSGAGRIEKKEDLKMEENTATIINMPAELIGEEGASPIILDRETALQNLQRRIFVKPNYTSSTSINLVTEYYVFLATRAAQLKLTTNMYFHILLNEDRFYREITGDHEPIFEQVMYKYKGSRSHKNISFAEDDRKYFIEESARLGIKYTVFAHYLIDKEMDREKWKGKRKIGEIILRED